jgi:hypothetical protein
MRLRASTVPFMIAVAVASSTAANANPRLERTDTAVSVAFAEPIEFCKDGGGGGGSGGGGAGGGGGGGGSGGSGSTGVGAAGGATGAGATRGVGNLDGASGAGIATGSGAGSVGAANGSASNGASNGAAGGWDTASYYGRGTQVERARAYSLRDLLQPRSLQDRGRLLDGRLHSAIAAGTLSLTRARVNNPRRATDAPDHWRASR